MLFVDGENLTARGESFAADASNGLNKAVYRGQWYQPGEFLWLPNQPATLPLHVNMAGDLQERAVRAYYYTATNDSRIPAVRQALWDLSFQPEVFTRNRQGRSKGVDLTLAKDLLSNAFMGNYDVAVLIAGDGDYVPLVEEVKRLGRIVVVVFFKAPNCGLNNDLRLAADTFSDLGPILQRQWKAAGAPADAEFVRPPQHGGKRNGKR